MGKDDCLSFNEDTIILSSISLKKLTYNHSPIIRDTMHPYHPRFLQISDYVNSHMQVYPTICTDKIDDCMSKQADSEKLIS